MDLGALECGIVLKRYKRFFMDVAMADGSLRTLHCANTGSMRSLLLPGTRAWFSTSHNPKRKLAHSLEILELPDGTHAFVNTVRCNAIVEEALLRGMLEGAPVGTPVRREVRSGDSRVDFLLEPAQAHPCWVEVKNTTLVESQFPGLAQFPDAVTERGTKHLQELARSCNRGERGVILFLANRSDAQVFCPAAHLDPLYSRTLAQVQGQGVEIVVWKTEITCCENHWKVEVSHALPYHLQHSGDCHV